MLVFQCTVVAVLTRKRPRDMMPYEHLKDSISHPLSTCAEHPWVSGKCAQQQEGP